uniref:Uncharacterized protein n=1 Tax=Rhizophora mucronata TaxID=61149 RepID=A0A2P2PA59_RHIMU
MKGRGPLSTS